MQIPWPVILPILHLIWSSASPALKAFALQELKALEIANQGNAVVDAIIKEAEVLVAAA